MPVNAPMLRLLPAALIALATLPASAQTQQEVKDAFEMMVGSSAICSDYLSRPEILADNRALGLRQLVAAGLSEAEANEFMDRAEATALADRSTETQKQVACEIVNVPALK